MSPPQCPTRAEARAIVLVLSGGLFWQCGTAAFSDAPDGVLPPDLVALQGDEPRRGESPPGKKGQGAPELPVPPVQTGAGKDRVPEIPKEQLPKLTRPRPDPVKVQYTQVPIYAEVFEKVRLMDDPVDRIPVVPVVQNYLVGYFGRAGFPVEKEPAAAAYRIEGSVEVKFVTDLKLRGKTIAWKFSAESVVRILDALGREVDRSEVRGLDRVNVKSEDSAVWDLRRVVAKQHHDNLFFKGKVFSNRQVADLIELWAKDPLEAETPVRGEQVVERIADLGLAAVPYLLEALTDTRTVLVETEYPGIKTPEDLRVYHLADKALEEIFQKVSRLRIDTPEHHRFVIIKGWENEWRRFCPPFRATSGTSPPPIPDTKSGGDGAPGER